MKTSGGEAIDEQNIQALQHALCLTPVPLNVNVSARVLPKVMLGFFFSSVRANALQATLTLNFGGEGVVPDRPDRRGFDISSIYGSFLACARLQHRLDRQV